MSQADMKQHDHVETLWISLAFIWLVFLAGLLLTNFHYWKIISCWKEIDKTGHIICDYWFKNKTKALHCVVVPAAAAAAVLVAHIFSQAMTVGVVMLLQTGICGLIWLQILMLSRRWILLTLVIPKDGLTWNLIENFMFLSALLVITLVIWNYLLYDKLYLC